MKYFCIIFNEDNSNILKYYCSEYLDKCYYDLTKPTKFVNIYKIKKTKDYKLKDIKYDKIISTFSKDDKYIELIEDLYKIKLQYLRKIGEFILDNNFINYRGINLLDIILKYDFNMIGLEVKKISNKTINKINDKNSKDFYLNIKKEKEKNEKILIKIISKSVN